MVLKSQDSVALRWTDCGQIIPIEISKALTISVRAFCLDHLLGGWMEERSWFVRFGLNNSDIRRRNEVQADPSQAQWRGPDGRETIWH